jgi:cell wall-associated NlpC family hydrolase
VRLHRRLAVTLLATAALGVGLIAPAADAAPVRTAPAAAVTAGTPAPPPRSSAASRAATRAVAMRTRAAAIGRAKAYHAQYVAGAAGPNAFDCSGFTSWVWRQAGHRIPRTSYEQYSSLQRISRSQARAGDLVFFFRGGVHHVGLYLGNGTMVHAANPRRDVLISRIDGPWYAEHFSGFRRVV